MDVKNDLSETLGQYLPSSAPRRLLQFVREPSFLGLCNLLILVPILVLTNVPWNKIDGFVEFISAEICKHLPPFEYNHLIIKICLFLIVLLLWISIHSLIIRGRSMRTGLRNTRSLENKSILITGANVGIGYECALQCAKWGMHVILACRTAATDDSRQVTDALQKIIEETGNRNMEIINLDLNDLLSVSKCVDSIKKKKYKLYCLVCNAGVMMTPYGKTVQGFETQFGINHLGHFALIYPLIDYFKQMNTRVILTSSVAHTLAQAKKSQPAFDINDDILNVTPSKYSDSKYYAYSKLANILCSKELQRIFDEDGTTTATSYSLHPGAVKSEWIRNMSLLNKFIYKLVWYRVYKPTTKHGAQTTLTLIAEDLKSLSPGGYYCDCKCVKPTVEAEDITFAQIVWDKSYELIKPFIN